MQLNGNIFQGAIFHHVVHIWAFISVRMGPQESPVNPLGHGHDFGHFIPDFNVYNGLVRHF